VPLNRDGRQFQAEALPLAAIYVLDEREASLISPIVEDLTGHAALSKLVTNTYVNYLLNREMRSLEFDVLARVLRSIPVRRVRPTCNALDLFDLCKTVDLDIRQVWDKTR
jgi:hypothetical protein